MSSDPRGYKNIEKVQINEEGNTIGVDNTSSEEHLGTDGHVDFVDNGAVNDSSMGKDENGGSKEEIELEDKPIHTPMIAGLSLNDTKERRVDVKEQIEPEQKKIASPRRRDRLEKLRKKRIDAVNATRQSIWVQTQTEIDVAEVIQPSIETDQNANREKEEDEKHTITSTEIEQVGKEVDCVSVTNKIEVPAPPATLQVHLEDTEGLTMSPLPRNTDIVENQDAQPCHDEAIVIEKDDEEEKGGNIKGGEALKQPDAIVSSLDNYIDLSSSSSSSCNDDDDKYSVVSTNSSEDSNAMDKHESIEKKEIEFQSGAGSSVKRPQFNKTNRQISEGSERALTNSSSNLTTASQVTTKHGNTTNKGLRNPVPPTNSMVSLNSDISSLNPDEGTLGSEEYKREIERLRMRKIKLQSVAVSVGMNNNIEPMETLTEVSKLSSSEHDIVLFDSNKSGDLGTSTFLTSTQNRSDEIEKSPKCVENSATSVESRPSNNGRLVMVAVIGLIGGVLGSIFSYDTCEFVSIRKKVGYYDEVLQVSAGMKYFTSIDTVFTGGSQCIAYDHENLYYTQDPPQFAKIFSLFGLAFGVTSVVILWIYILTKKTTPIFWNIASVFSCVASIAQLLTFQFYFSPICENEDCSIGAGTVSSFIAALSYGCIGYEMIGNKPSRRISSYELGEKLIKDNEKNDDFYKAPSIV